MTDHLAHKKHTRSSHGSVRNYAIGFISSVFLTFFAYIIVVGHMFDTSMAIAIIMGLAVIQLIVQLVFFLHLGQESKPRWNIAALLFMLLVVAIIVGGSLWIMNNLNYNMSPAQMNHYMTEQNKKGF